MKKSVILLIAVLAVGWAYADERGVVVVAETHSSKVVYETEGHQRDLDGVIAMLRERAKKTGINPQNDTALVLVSKDLSINQIQSLQSALAAYGFLDIRLFAFLSDKVHLQKVSFDMKPIRFTKDRVELMQAIGGNPEMANAQNKARLSSLAQKSLQRLHAIADADAASLGDVDADSRQKGLAREIASVIDNIGDPDELGAVARLSYVLAYPENAETIRYDEVYSLAYKQCVSKLRKMKSKKAESVLTLIREQFNLRGHALELFESL